MDTRELVRWAYPFVLAQGTNPSVNEIKTYIRSNVKDLPVGWNPSMATVSSELQAIRIELGKRLLTGNVVDDETLPEDVAQAVLAAGRTLWGSLSELSDQKCRLRLAEAQSIHDQRETILQNEIDALRVEVGELQQRSAALQAGLDAAKSDGERYKRQAVDLATEIELLKQDALNCANSFAAEMDVERGEKAELARQNTALITQAAQREQRFTEEAAVFRRDIEYERDGRNQALLDLDAARQEIKQLKKTLVTTEKEASQKLVAQATFHITKRRQVIKRKD